MSTSRGAWKFETTSVAQYDKVKGKQSVILGKGGSYKIGEVGGQRCMQGTGWRLENFLEGVYAS